jgi:hypothetical protein
MNYDEEEVLSDSTFGLNEDGNLDDESLEEPLEEKEDFRFDEEEPEAL